MRYLIIDTEGKGNIIGTEFQSEFEIDGRILTEKESLAVFKAVWNHGAEKANDPENDKTIFGQFAEKRL